MGRNAYGSAVDNPSTRSLSDALLIISSYCELKGKTSELIYPRLIAWGRVALEYDGRSPQWIDRLLARQPNVKLQWWMVRQLLPEQAIQALARHLDRLI